MPGSVSIARTRKRRRNLADDRSRKLLGPILIIVLVLIADQITKFWAVSVLTDLNSVPLLGQFFQLSLVYNEGGAMGTNLGSSSFYLVIALILIPILGFYVYHSRANRRLAYPLSFIVAGAIGNVIDRIRLGKVIDFLDVDFFDITIGSFQIERWWTFNIADAAISCSLVYLIMLYLFQPKPSPARPLPVK